MPRHNAYVSAQRLRAARLTRINTPVNEGQDCKNFICIKATSTAPSEPSFDCEDKLAPECQDVIYLTQPYPDFARHNFDRCNSEPDPPATTKPRAFGDANGRRSSGASPPAQDISGRTKFQCDPTEDIIMADESENISPKTGGEPDDFPCLPVRAPSVEPCCGPQSDDAMSLDGQPPQDRQASADPRSNKGLTIIHYWVDAHHGTCPDDAIPPCFDYPMDLAAHLASSACTPDQMAFFIQLGCKRGWFDERDLVYARALLQNIKNPHAPHTVSRFNPLRNMPHDSYWASYEIVKERILSSRNRRSDTYRRPPQVPSRMDCIEEPYALRTSIHCSECRRDPLRVKAVAHDYWILD